jgi:hypothetical protein
MYHTGLFFADFFLKKKLKLTHRVNHIYHIKELSV